MYCAAAATGIASPMSSSTAAAYANLWGCGGGPFTTHGEAAVKERPSSMGMVRRGRGHDGHSEAPPLVHLPEGETPQGHAIPRGPRRVQGVLPHHGPRRVCCDHVDCCAGRSPDAKAWWPPRTADDAPRPPLKSIPAVFAVVHRVVHPLLPFCKCVCKGLQHLCVARFLPRRLEFQGTKSAAVCLCVCLSVCLSVCGFLLGLAAVLASSLVSVAFTSKAGACC
jgi:hypothetical protein